MSPSHVSTPCLSDLPAELVFGIARLADPVALVSLHQTNKRFRALITIGKRELVERLLQLELTKEHGGGTLTLRVREQILDPRFSEEKWAEFRWACSSCLRLRSHIHFDNRSILRLQNRKPIAGSPAAVPISTWEPSLRGKLWGSKTWKPISYEERLVRLRYRLAVYPYETYYPPFIHRWTVEELRAVGMQGFDHVDDNQYQHMNQIVKDAILDRNLLDIELITCGSKRHNRMCNECRYQSGQLRVQLGVKRGTPTFPIMTSRKVHFPSAYSRFFPRLPEFLGMPEPDFYLPIGEISQIGNVFVMGPVGLYSRPWTMYMGRCSGCETWQEVRSFRLGGYEAWWNPKLDAHLWHDEHLAIEDLPEIICNGCYARKYGKLALGRLLGDFLGWVVCENARRYLEAQLCWGWFALQRVVTNFPAEYRKQVRSILKNVYGKMKRAWEGDDFSYLDIATLKMHHGEFVNVCRDGLATSGNQAVRELFHDFWFNTWFYAFDLLEMEWCWMTEYTTKAREYPEALAEWALGRDPAAFEGCE
ncbi:unnamed protein product [Clonostachys byssicola]|uniref:F-box domain-containing protein n=1 Tax=Clonostachys byssicola TaxID=160290 RepID=A0A9N9Y5J0_9HYPO|nr:unnamed protein product [Clonostachys byssicola]